MKEERACQNCKSPFIIEDEDFQFYKKIDVPPPTWCPQCRMIRRMLWRNERLFYRRKCDLCGEEGISSYAPDLKLKIYCPQCFWSDEWDAREYQLDLSFSKPFLCQLAELIESVPHIRLGNVNSVRSPYVSYGVGNKDSYLLFASSNNEHSLYSRWIFDSKSLVDSLEVSHSVEGYALVGCERVSNSIFVEDSSNSFNLILCSDCRNCQDCIGCSGLRNKKHCIFNKQLEKKKYEEEKEKIMEKLGSYDQIKNLLDQALKIKLKTPKKHLNITKCENCSGDNIFKSKNLKSCFHVEKGESSSFVLFGYDIKDSYDISFQGYLCERDYEIMGIEKTASSVCNAGMLNNFDVNYSFFSFNSSHLFGCVGLRNKEYCILNKQYTKEKYEELVPRIKEHMSSMPYVDKKGRVYKYGEFFPSELSPFAYNETIAQEYFPLTKEEAQEKGYGWRDPDTKDYKPTILSKDLPDHIKDVPDSITKEIIQCAHTKLTTDNQQPKTNCNHQCATAFRIIPEELQFYRRMNPARPDDPSGRSGGLPLPRLCPNCRHYERLAQRNPLKLWHRKCMCAGRKSEIRDAKSEAYTNTATHFHGSNPCPSEFETSYSPEREEVVYCERCYQQEVI